MDVFKWSGDSRGGFDSTPNSFSPSFTYTNNNGNVRLKYEHEGASLIQVGDFNGDLSTSWRICLELTGFPESTKSIIEPLTELGGRSWRFVLTADGALILHDANGSWRGGFYDLPLNQEFRIEIVATTSGLDARRFPSAYSTEIVDQISTTTGVYGPVNNIRIGATSGAPYIPTLYVDDIRVEAGNEDWLGPGESVSISGDTYAIIGDSNTEMGSSVYAPLYESLQSRNIPTDNVYVYGIHSKRMLEVDIIGRETIQNIQDAKQGFGDISHWLIALGGNNSSDSQASMASDINEILNLIGPEGKVTWIGLSAKGSNTANRNTFNQVLQNQLPLRPNSFYADWDQYIRSLDNGQEDSIYWLPDDNIHMSEEGYVVRANYFADILAGNVGPSDFLWKSVMLGEKEASRVYLGDHVVWSN